MKHVLFVDDEPHILEGLRNTLRRQRDQWAMSFHSSGAAALEYLATQTCDVMVTDMRMPGMDGASLLQTVKERYPQMARVILSGQTGRDDMLRATPAMQQFLAKPCDPQLLRETVERLCRVQCLMHDERIRSLVGALDRLPSFPESYRRLTALMEDDSSDANDIVEVAQSDAALSTKLLQLANSAYFGQPGATVSVRQAVCRVGIDLIRSLALSAQLFAGLSPALLKIPSIATLADRSLFKAQLASRLVEDRTLSDEVFTTALLMDVGQIVLANSLGNSYAEALHEAEAGERPLHDIEQQRLGVTHAGVGAYLLGIWGLPIRLVDYVARHHIPSLAEDAPAPGLIAVHLADTLVDAVLAGSENPLQALDPGILADEECKRRAPAALAATVEMLAAAGACR